jgi:hypothetical protein
MKHWTKVKMQCEAKEILGVECEETTEIEVCNLIAVDKWLASHDMGWRLSASAPGGAPCVFCSKHAEAGLAVVDKK